MLEAVLSVVVKSRGTASDHLVCARRRLHAPRPWVRRSHLVYRGSYGGIVRPVFQERLFYLKMAVKGTSREIGNRVCQREAVKRSSASPEGQ